MVEHLELKIHLAIAAEVEIYSGEEFYHGLMLIVISQLLAPGDLQKVSPSPSRILRQSWLPLEWLAVLEVVHFNEPLVLVGLTCIVQLESLLDCHDLLWGEHVLHLQSNLPILYFTTLNIILLSLSHGEPRQSR